MSAEQLLEVLFDQAPDEDAVRGAGTRGLRYRTRTIKSGPVTELEIYPLWPTATERRRARALTERVSRDAVREVNRRNAAKKLDRLMNTNFTEQDLHLTLTYVGEPPAPEQGQKDVRNYIRRVREWRRKHGFPELQYIYVVEWEETEPERERIEAAGDGLAVDESGQVCAFGVEEKPAKLPRRIHHHVVMSGMDRDVAESLWKHGRVNSRRLQPDDFGLNDLAAYMVKAPKTRKRWYASRNLKQPKVTVSDHKFSKRQIREFAEGVADAPGRVLSKKFPSDRLVVPPRVRSSEFVSGLYIYARMIRRE